MGIVLGLCCVLLSPIMLMIIGLVRYLHDLHKQFGKPKPQFNHSHLPECHQPIAKSESVHLSYSSK
jgi:hypothetical protein